MSRPIHEILAEIAAAVNELAAVMAPAPSEQGTIEFAQAPATSAAPTAPEPMTTTAAPAQEPMSLTDFSDGVLARNRASGGAVAALLREILPNYGATGIASLPANARAQVLADIDARLP